MRSALPFCGNDVHSREVRAEKTNSTVATAIRTIIVLIMSFFMVLIVGSLKDIATVSARNWVFLVLSGIATGASWLCYFRAIQLGDVNKVAPIDKSSTILTILLAFIVLKEPVSWLQSVCVCMISAGTFMMIEKRTSASLRTQAKRGFLMRRRLRCLPRLRRFSAKSAFRALSRISAR